MKTIFADYNAATESGDLCLNFRASQKDIATARLRPGDWAWLSDSEVIVGAQLAIDDYFGLVGVPDWETLVHLDDEGADYDHVTAELNPLLTKEPLSTEDEPRILQLITQLEHVAPPEMRQALTEMFAFRRALALRQMNKLGLALVEMKEVRSARPGDPDIAVVYLELLRHEDLPSAVAEAHILTRLPTLPALVLSACINIFATQAEQTSNDEFESIAERVFALCSRFDEAPDLDQVEDSLRALSYFNRGMMHLRGGRISQARQAFLNAQQIYSVGPVLDRLAGLQTYDQHARVREQRARDPCVVGFPEDGRRVRYIVPTTQQLAEYHPVAEALGPIHQRTGIGSIFSG